VLVDKGVAKEIKIEKAYPPCIMNFDNELLIGRPGNYLSFEMKRKEAIV